MFLPIGFFNDDFYPIEDISIPATDLGTHRGYGIFDFFKLKNLQNPWIDWYLERLVNSALATNLALPFHPSKIVVLISELLLANDTRDGYVKVILTGGKSDDGYTYTERPTFLMMASSIKTPDDNLYKSGAKLLSVNYMRDMPSVKTTNYTQSAMLAHKLKANNCVDVLYHYDGIISETSRCNFFIVKNGNIHTRQDGILEGITRKRVLSLEKESGRLVLQSISLSQLKEADEAFITSTSKGVMPVTSIDNIVINHGAIGPVTKGLMSSINVF